MSPEPTDRCPVCGGAMARGCLYGADKAPLSWVDGPPNWEKNLYSALGDGIRISQHAFLAGVYAEGHCCVSCRHIILKY